MGIWGILPFSQSAEGGRLPQNLIPMNAAMVPMTRGSAFLQKEEPLYVSKEIIKRCDESHRS